MVPQYIDIAISKVLVVENRNDFCTVHAQIENRGTMVISGKTVTITATINGQTVTKTIMVEHMVPRQIYTIDFDDMVPKDWNRRYEGSGTVTMANDANAINNHICPVIGKQQIRDVTYSDIQLIMSNSAKLSKSAQQKIVTSLRRIFDAAVADKIILESPCAGLKPGGQDAQEKQPDNKMLTRKIKLKKYLKE